ncbi:MAG: rhodanese-related sulfurtransferase [Sphingomonadales bacterium]|nr:rhodanese-related sulfurtransferase [Sphingomonadales bacterium]NCQ22536.1 rhodanese-related sulfurtransferase [Sphingomonadales bacterium]NCT05080.1 rhodanese-related sulfurtransferase [Sphingomonadales bacterium]
MIHVAALYHFTPLPDPEALRAPLLAACEAHGIKGTLLLAREGINGTLAGTDNALASVLGHIRTLPGCADTEVKFSTAPEMPFHRMKVRVKREIVTMGEPDIDPTLAVGHYVDPHDWNALIADPDTIVIDTRNDYEVAVGTFAGAVDPQTPSFRDFPAWFREHREALLDGKKKVAMFCTGGIRCEKSTSFLRSEGVEEVYHLKGGILKYLEEVPESQSLWQGECFVFDERVTVRHGLAQGTFQLCRACRRPLDAEAFAHRDYEDGVSCPACINERTPEQRAGYAERQRQEALAKARGELHVGAVLPPKG